MKTLRLILISIALGASAAQACDLCAVYASLQAKESATGWFGGVAEQYTHFGTLRDDGEKVPNPLDQKLDSSITQLFAGYQFSSSFGVQANLPYIHRSFRRPEGEEVETGSENGIGDSVVLAHWRPWLKIDGDSLFALTLLGGIKLPTGSSDRIAEELAEGDEEEELALATSASTLGLATLPHEGHEHGPASGIHGHDLALGSGSVDGLVGANAFWRYRRAFANFSAQYSIRNTGDFDYRYANDFNWAVNPGFYLDLEHENTTTLGLVLSGEHKGQDELAGEPTDDTAIEAVYLGPQLTYSRGASLYLDLAADFPLQQHNSALQAVPDYRIRFALTWRP